MLNITHISRTDGLNGARSVGVLACELRHRPGASITISNIPLMSPAARRRRNSQPGRPRYDKISGLAAGACK